MLRQFLTSKITREKLDPFIQRHASDKRTLDIGCANSAYSRHFPNRVGLDIEPGTGVDVVADAHDLPFPDSSFELVLCTEVLEHLHTPQRGIDEMYRVLAPGGTLLLTTRFVFPLHDTPHDYFRYTKYGLKHLMKAFEEVTLEEETSSFGTVGVLFQRLAMQCDFRGGVVVKIFLLLLARCLHLLQFLVRDEYGKRMPNSHKESAILTSGYYVTAKKPIASA